MKQKEQSEQLEAEGNGHSEVNADQTKETMNEDVNEGANRPEVPITEGLDGIKDMFDFSFLGEIFESRVLNSFKIPRKRSLAEFMIRQEETAEAFDEEDWEDLPEGDELVTNEATTEVIDEGSNEGAGQGGNQQSEMLGDAFVDKVLPRSDQDEVNRVDDLGKEPLADNAERQERQQEKESPSKEISETPANVEPVPAEKITENAAESVKEDVE